jgi:hypothetical protein
MAEIAPEQILHHFLPLVGERFITSDFNTPSRSSSSPQHTGGDGGTHYCAFPQVCFQNLSTAFHTSLALATIL